LRYYTDNYNTYNLESDKSEFFDDEKISLLQGLSSCMFVTKNIFSTKTNFFGINDFYEIEFFHHTFIDHNITHYKSEDLSPG